MNLRIVLTITIAAVVNLSGCANAPKADPLEGMNRATYAFNDAVDTSWD